MLNKTQYFEICKNFDWFYSFSDNHAIYSTFHPVEVYMRDLADEQPELKLIFDAWHDFSFSGTGFGKPSKKEPKLDDFCKL